jgi:hypothetical protein
MRQLDGEKGPQKENKVKIALSERFLVLVRSFVYFNFCGIITLQNLGYGKE